MKLTELTEIHLSNAIETANELELYSEQNEEAMAAAINVSNVCEAFKVIAPVLERLQSVWWLGAKTKRIIKSFTEKVLLVCEFSGN